MIKRVFCFGSNEAGRHGAGAALTAYKKHGARYGVSYGHVGDSFAIPTKDQDLKPLELWRIGQYVQGFLAYAAGHQRDLTFQVTQIGCGLAGFTAQEIAPMFKGATSNCLFDDLWFDAFLGGHPSLAHLYNFWGTFE